MLKKGCKRFTTFLIIVFTSFMLKFSIGRIKINVLAFSGARSLIWMILFRAKSSDKVNRQSVIAALSMFCFY